MAALTVLRSTMNVRSPKTRCYLVLSVNCFGFPYKIDVCLKKTIIGYLYTQTRQIDCFRRVHKILRWIGSSDLNCKLNWQRHFAFNIFLTDEDVSYIPFVRSDLDKVTNESDLEVCLYFYPISSIFFVRFFNIIDTVS